MAGGTKREREEDLTPRRSARLSSLCLPLPSRDCLPLPSPDGEILPVIPRAGSVPNNCFNVPVVKMEPVSVTDKCTQTSSNECSQTTLEELAQSDHDSNFVYFLLGSSQEPLVEKKFYFTIASDVFKTMFTGAMRETGVVKIEDIEPDAFKILVQFIKGEDVVFQNNETASRVCYAAEKYNLPGLKELCAEALYPMTLDEVWLALEVGLQYHIRSLVKQAVRVIENDTITAFSSKAFLHISKEALVKILVSNNLSVPFEVDVLQAAISWSKFQCSCTEQPLTQANIRNTLGDAVNHIRFLIMTRSDIINFASAILLPQELEQILLEKDGEKTTLFTETTFSLSKRIRGSTNIRPQLNDPQQSMQRRIVTLIYDLEFIDAFYCRRSKITREFGVRENAILHEILIPSLSRTLNNSSHYYFEDITATITVKNDSREVGTGKFKGKAKFNNNIKISFHDERIGSPSLSARGPSITINEDGNQQNMVEEGDLLTYCLTITFNRAYKNAMFPRFNVTYNDVFHFENCSTEDIILGCVYSLKKI